MDTVVSHINSPFGIIYKATNLINGKCYIGKTTQQLKNRINDHVYAATFLRDNMTFHKAIRKYNIDNFKWTILCECEDELVLNIMETMKIIVEHTHISENLGYNLTWGGEGISGYKHTKETKKKISILKKGKSISEEHKINISKARKNWSFSDKTKKKLSESAKKRGISNETRHKMTKSRLKYNDEIILNIKEMIKKGMTQKEIGKEIGVNQSTISDWIKLFYFNKEI